MGTIWFVNVNHTIFKGKNLHWTQSDACTTTKTSIFIDDEFMRRNSRHDLWKNSL